MAVTSAVRGYAGTLASDHAAGTPYSKTDVIHLGEKGRTLVAQQVAAKIRALGW